MLDIESDLWYDVPMKVGDRVRVRMMEQNDKGWSIVFKEGLIEKDFLYTVGSQSLYHIILDGGDRGNFWNDQMEVLAP